MSGSIGYVAKYCVSHCAWKKASPWAVCPVILESVPSVTVSSLAGKAREQPVPRSCETAA